MKSLTSQIDATMMRAGEGVGPSALEGPVLKAAGPASTDVQEGSNHPASGITSMGAAGLTCQGQRRPFHWVAVVTLVSTLAVLIGACEDGPGVAAEPHAIEGTWEIVEGRLRVRGYDRSEERNYDQEHPVTIPEETRVQFTFEAGVFTMRAQYGVDDPWTTIRGTYLIDEESDRVMVLMEYGGGSDVSNVYRYKLSGSAGLELRQQIRTDDQTLFPRKADEPWVLIIEGAEVVVHQTESIYVLKRV